MGILSDIGSGVKEVVSRLGGAIAGAATGWFTGPVGIFKRSVLDTIDAGDDVPWAALILGSIIISPLTITWGTLYSIYSGLRYGFERGVAGELHDDAHRDVTPGQSSEETQAQAAARAVANHKRDQRNYNRDLRQKSSLKTRDCYGAYVSRVQDPSVHVKSSSASRLADSSHSTSAPVTSPRVSAAPYSNVSTMKQQGVFRAKSLPSDKSSINAPTRRLSQGNAS